MKKQNGIRAVLWTVLMLAAVLTGCCADGEDACTLDPANPARFTCGGVESRLMVPVICSSRKFHSCVSEISH